MSYFGRLAQTARNDVREFGFIKNLNKEKGRAFIIPESGGNDVFLSLMELSDPGCVVIENGMRVSFRRYRARNGKYRAADVTPATASVKSSRHADVRSPVNQPNGNLLPTQPQGEWQNAVVKFYDPEKGYGFVRVRNDSNDAFLPRRTVQASQLDPRLRLKDVPAKVLLVPGQKQGSMEVYSIILQ